jgi:sortase A
VPKNRSPQDLSVDELRWLLIEKRRAARQERLERYRRTGRVVMVASDLENPVLEDWHTGTLTEETEEGVAPARRSRGKRILDGFLLLIEISAVVGFIFILFNGLSLIQELNREVVAVLEQPTLTPTALIVAVVLPSTPRFQSIYDHWCSRCTMLPSQHLGQSRPFACRYRLSV